MAGLLLAVGSSRMQELSSSEDSAQGRIQAWSAGLGMLRSSPVLGVGFGSFTEYHELVAHNSFVHSLAELGLVGGYFFVGMFYWHFVCTSARRNVAGSRDSVLALDLWASGAGVLVCALFLSRQYSPVLYVPLALGAARVATTPWDPPDTPFQRGSDWLYVALLSGGVVVGSYLVVTFLARWSGG
jgi:O-antigen ligase